MKDITNFVKENVYTYIFFNLCFYFLKHCTIFFGIVYPDCLSCLFRKPPDAELAPETSNFNWQRVMLVLELLQHKKKLKRPQALVPALFNLLSR